MYLQNGLGWMPEYLVEMTDAKNARIILRGVCFNKTNDYTDEPANANAANGEQQQDLFFYNLKNLTIRKGERISYDLMTVTVPLTHVHRIQMNKNDHDKPLASGQDAGFENRTTATVNSTEKKITATTPTTSTRS